MTTIADRYRGCLLGLAAGDALGATVEFRARGEFPPVTDVVGGGAFHLRPGEWTDDTSMAMCLASSLLECGGFDAKDQMDRYVRWWREGYWSATGRCLDIGGTVRDALERFLATGDPLAGPIDPRCAGNACIMRLAAVPLFYFPDRAAAVRFAGLSARTTHGNRECIDACRLLADILWLALSGAEKERALLDHGRKLLKEERVRALAHGRYFRKSANDVRGSAYVVESLEAALWCFWTTTSFEAAVLRAANLGDDADTTAAVCGQVAGAYYGRRAIPERWLATLARGAEIESAADALLVRSRQLFGVPKAAERADAGAAIRTAFAAHFARWGLELADEDVRARRAGRLRQAGWDVQYCFGGHDGTGWLDLYAVHPIAGHQHLRILADGRQERLPEFLDAHTVVGRGPRCAVRASVEQHNRRVAESLAAKGFVVAADHPTPTAGRPTTLA